MQLPNPSPELVAEHRRAYDASLEGGLPDEAVSAVFRAFPANTYAPHVLAKIAVLDSLYSTSVFAVRDAAVTIVEATVDPLLHSGAPEALERLAALKLGGKVRNAFSFATKYAHWHRLEVYPVYDSFVHEQLMLYQRRDRFTQFMAADLRTLQFLSIFAQFRSYYGLEGCSLRDIDKWLWRQGRAWRAQNAT